MQRPWLLACLALACGSAPLPEGDTPPEPVECEVPLYPTEVEPAYVGVVEAVVLDLEDNPSPNLLVQVCGIDICVPGTTEADGSAVIGADTDIKRPAFKYGDGHTHGKIALPLEAPFDELDLGEVYTPAMPAEGAAITAGGVTSSGGVELLLAEGTQVKFDRLEYRTPDEQAFRAAELPIDRVPAGLDAGLGLELFFALTPPLTEFCPPAGLRLPNSAGWPAGTELEFHLHGLDPEERHAPYAGFAHISDGVVSEDGATLEMVGGGLPWISLVAVKRKE